MISTFSQRKMSLLASQSDFSVFVYPSNSVAKMADIEELSGNSSISNKEFARETSAISRPSTPQQADNFDKGIFLEEV